MTAQAATAMQPAKTSVPVKQTSSETTFERFQQTYDSIARRAFEIFDGNGRWFGRDLADWLQAESEILHPVHLKIMESDDSLTVRAEVPGFTTKELEINVEPRQLTISGKHETREETRKGKTICSEQCAQEILRSVALSVEVDGSKVTATLKDGVLNIELPKAARVETKTAN